jgi:hypothetical protein
MEIETTITTEEVIQGEIGKPRFEMWNDGSGYQGRILFTIARNGLPSNDIEVKISTIEWNDFWSKFSSGKYLIELLKAEYDLSTLVIPNDIETWFSNVV